MTLGAMSRAMRKILHICFFCTLVALILYGCSAYRRLQIQAELRKYEASVRIASVFLQTFHQETDGWEKEVNDAWGRPFNVFIDCGQKRIVFISKGSNCKTDVDDLIIEFSKSAYHQKYVFGNYCCDAAEFYD